MSAPLVFGLPGNEPLAAGLAAALGGEPGGVESRRFPDGETYLRLRSDPRGRRVVLVATLDRPDEKFLPIAFAAGAARDLGARSVGLVAPYLAYMRQDRRFREGESVTSADFARLVSACVDWLVTVDPHLHRRHALAEIYSIPACALAAAPLLAAWIERHVEAPLVIGPDAESERWVADVAARAGAPWRVLRKERLGDRDVAIAFPDLAKVAGRRVVLMDDIVSSGETMLTAARGLAERGFAPPVCLAVHALFAEGAAEALAEAAAAVVTTDTVAHATNAIAVAPLIAAGVAELLEG
jgi:ribose-phosphate pyrophosphokinase